MNELQWIQDQVPFEARGAAREAARHEGKTLGEWLHDVIADHAADLGQPADMLTEDERAEAVALRLEHLRQRIVSFDSRQRPAHRSWTMRRSDYDNERRVAGQGGRSSERYRRQIPGSVAQNRLLDRAVDMLALDPRDRRPMRHEASHSSAAPDTGGLEPKADGGYRQFDQKLDTILEAVKTRPAIEQEEAEARDPSPTSDRRLGQAIADVVRRQRTLNLAEITPVAPRVPLRRRAAKEETALANAGESTSNFAPAHAAQSPIVPLQPMGAGNELALLCSEIAETLREHHDRRGSTMQAPSATPRHTIFDEPPTSPKPASTFPAWVKAAPPPAYSKGHGSRRTPSAIQATIATRAEEQDRDQKSGSTEAASGSAPNTSVDSAAMAAIATLQRQVADLSRRYEATDAYRVQLQTIDQRLLRLAEDHAITAGRFEATAADAARGAVEALMTTGRFARIDAAAREVTSFRDRQTAAENRTMLALDSVRETLNRVAERLVSVETGVTTALAVATPKPASPPPIARIEPRTAPAPAAPVSTPSSAGHPVAPPKRSVPSEKKIDQLDVEKDLISQARRSASAARKPALDMRRPLAQFPNGVPQTSVANEARTYLNRRRMPIGIGLAATGVIAAALAAMVNLPGISAHDSFATASTSLVAALPQPQPVRDTQPRALSQATAPGMNSMAFSVDPLETASFTKVAPGLPATLSPPVTSVPESGAAAYAQGDAYATGRGVTRDFVRAAQAFERAAHLGIVPAQVRLASLYDKGLGVERDREKAKALYSRAAEAGNPNAMHNLAVLLTDGAGHPDYDGAATWFRRAAQLGLRDSQFNLGVFYAEGLGVTRSYIESYQWFAIAADQGDDGAAKKRDIVATKLSPSDLMVAKAIASSFHPRRIEPAAVAIPQGGGQNLAVPVALNRV